VSQLKEFHQDYTPEYSPLADIPTLDVAEVLPEKILDRRLVKRGNVVVTQVHVQWTSLPETLATWEDFHVLPNRFLVAAV
jgi:hypothetical protein